MGDQRYGTASTGHTTAFTRKKRNIGPETQFTLRVVPVFFPSFLLEHTEITWVCNLIFLKQKVLSSSLRFFPAKTIV